MLQEMLIGIIYLLLKQLKLLFMKNVFIVFIRSLFIYLLVTLPALFSPVLYFFSAMFALSVCWVAGLIFAMGFQFVQDSNIEYSAKYYTLFVFVLLGVWIAFECIQLFGLWRNIWDIKIYLLFPLAAFISGCISLYLSQKAILIQFKNQSYDQEIHSNSSL